MRVFKTKVFNAWAQDIGLTDNHLKCAILEIKHGLIAARLGGNLIKQRIGLDGRGKSSSVRVIIAYKAGENLFFLDGFAKNEKDNIKLYELKILKKYAAFFFNLNAQDIMRSLENNELIEVKL